LKNKKLFSVIITVIFLVILMLVDQIFKLGIGKKASSILSPVGVVFSTTGENITGVFSGITHIGSLQKENSELTSKLNAALAEIAELSAAKKENDSLKLDLGFKQSSSLDLVPAVVAYFDPSLRDGITVRVDNAAGLKNGDVVMAEGFMIGRVSDINGNNIRILLITDSTSAIPVTLQDKDVTGIATGKIGNGITMEQVPQSDSVQKGDLVTTSGLGGDLPKGLILGKVDSVQKVAGSIFQQINLLPMTEFTKLERVMIVR
jgi:rod shape-determining protein MreC